LNDGKGFYGVQGFFDHLEEKKYKMHVRVFLGRLQESHFSVGFVMVLALDRAKWVLIAAKYF